MPARARNLATTIALTCVMAILLCLAQTASAVATKSPEKTASGIFFADPNIYTWEIAPESQQSQWEIALAATPTASGRQVWLSADPLGEEGGLNLYGYVGNDPLNAIDPLGLASWSDHWDALGTWTLDEFKDSAKVGAAATADGIVPFADPFKNNGVYNDCDDGAKLSRGLGQAARDIALVAAGQPLSGLKPFVTTGAARGSSIASAGLRSLTNSARLPFRVPTIVGTNIRMTNSLGGAAGRWTPFAGMVGLAENAGSSIGDALGGGSSNCP